MKITKFTFVFITLFILITYPKFLFLVPFASGWDQVDFSLAVKEYNVLKMQPHFPGYPFFILGALITNQFIHNPVLALSAFNQIMFVLAAIPIFLLANPRVGPNRAMFLVLILQSISYVTVLVAQPMSEGAALSIIWWYLWSLDYAARHKQIWPSILPALFFGLLMGIRLSYAVLGIGLIFLWLYLLSSKQSKYKVKILVNLLFIVVFQGIWIIAVANNVGGISLLVQIAFGFIEGHFSDWGGTAISSQASIIDRIRILLFLNIFWIGFATSSIILLIITIPVFIKAILPLQGWKVLIEDRLIQFLLISSFIYFLWSLFAQNIEKPRHILPLISILMFVLILRILIKPNRWSYAILATFLLFHNIIGIVYLKKQSTETPALYQLGESLKELKGNFIVYTWEETRIFEYLHVPFKHKRIQTYKLFEQEIKDLNNMEIYLTDKVVEGFRLQGYNVDGKIERVEQFSSDPLFDPVYNEIKLYRWKN